MRVVSTRVGAAKAKWAAGYLPHLGGMSRAELTELIEAAPRHPTVEPRMKSTELVDMAVDVGWAQSDELSALRPELDEARTQLRLTGAALRAAEAVEQVRSEIADADTPQELVRLGAGLAYAITFDQLHATTVEVMVNRPTTAIEAIATMEAAAIERLVDWARFDRHGAFNTPELDSAELKALGEFAHWCRMWGQ
jgi:hypothetical protein